jgi:choline dehydrogenase-like flavoprotein
VVAADVIVIGAGAAGLAAARALADAGLQVIVLERRDRLQVAPGDAGPIHACLDARQRIARQGAVNAVVQADHRVDVLDRLLAPEVRLPDPEGVPGQGQLHRQPAPCALRLEDGFQVGQGVMSHHCLPVVPSR